MSAVAWVGTAVIGWCVLAAIAAPIVAAFIRAGRGPRLPRR